MVVMNKIKSRTPPALPTDARPGSPEKIEVMRLRYENGEHLYHPQDATGAVLTSERLHPHMYRRERGNTTDLIVAANFRGTPIWKAFRMDQYDEAVVWLNNEMRRLRKVVIDLGD